uniref:Fau protein n=2 Tax=Homalodisca liturata TaxID=320908 RepID=A0A1B6J3T5_9HEMI
MVYESDFYTSRRPYSRPTITSYSVTTPRHYVVTDTPERPRRAEEQYSYSYTAQTESSSSSSRPGSSSVPSRAYSSSSERVSRSSGSGPESYSYSTERSSRSSDYPGSYNASYSSTTSGRLPHGTTYRHFSYRV